MKQWHTFQFLAFEFNLRFSFVQRKIFPIHQTMQKFVLIFSVLQVKSIQIKIDFPAFIFFQKDSYSKNIDSFQSNFRPLGEHFWWSVLINDNPLCKLGINPCANVHAMQIDILLWQVFLIWCTVYQPTGITLATYSSILNFDH